MGLKMTSRILRIRRALAATLGSGVIAGTACTDSPAGPSVSPGPIADASASDGAPMSANASQGLRLVYHATFGNGSLDSGVDPLGLGPMKPGDSQIANSSPTWTVEQGGITLGVTRPTVTVTGPVSAGLFVTPVDFDQGSVLGLRATFVAPAGPHETGTQFAVTLGARTGDEDDLFAETRNAVTFQVRANGARLNVVGASPPVNLPNMPQKAYDAIFDPVHPHSFTLEFVIDRLSGAGEATLIAKHWIQSVPFQPSAFKALSGPDITAVGVSIAAASGSGQTASVRVTDFQIFAVRRARTQS
jgi:hypothetical protein